MNRALCFAFAAASGIGLGGEAHAQAIFIDLDGLTNPAPTRSGSFVNIAVNNATIDGSVEAAFVATGFLESIGHAEATVDAAFTARQFAVTGSLGGIDTTTLGAVKYGKITLGGAILMDEAHADSAASLMRYTGPMKNAIAANMVLNQYGLDGSASVLAINYALDAGAVVTTAIGAFSSGSITIRLDSLLPDITLIAAN